MLLSVKLLTSIISLQSQFQLVVEAPWRLICDRRHQMLVLNEKTRRRNASGFHLWRAQSLCQCGDE
jgi:hypothetical protein